MLDIKFIRENADLIAAGAKKKHLTIDIGKLLAVDDKRRNMLTEVEHMRARQNETNDAVVNANPGERVDLIAQMKRLTGVVLNFQWIRFPQEEKLLTADEFLLLYLRSSLQSGNGPLNPIGILADKLLNGIKGDMRWSADN